jgi:hypothetical protein
MACNESTVHRAAFALVVAAAGTGCATSGFPWPASGPAATAIRKDVTTVNPSYRRSTSQVLVRRVNRPTRASLDYAAYHANFMNADPAPDGAPAGEQGKPPNTANPFGGALVAGSLTGSVARTALSPEERAHPNGWVTIGRLPCSAAGAPSGGGSAFMKLAW